MEHLVLTVIAADQPGLVERIAHCIASHGGNWLDSRMSRMAGQFAGILRVTVAPELRQALIDDLHALDAQGVRVQLAEAGQDPATTWRSVYLDLIGNDRPGIVRDITRLLSGLGVNLERFNTEVTPAPMSGELLFHAEARLAVPLALELDTLQEKLESLADDLMVELKLRADSQ